MIKESKDLLLHDLCARIPYGFVIHRYSDNVDITVDSIAIFSHFLEYSEDEEFKPYLRPMSSMTEEEKIYYQAFFNYDGVEYPEEYIDWLNKHHFDYRGLIEKGLALEAPEGMYKNENKNC